MLVFDLTDRRSFEDLIQWLTEVYSLCDPNAVVTLVGNKSDLADRRAVTPVEAEGFADLHQLTYIETSARGGVNVQEAFSRAAAAIYRRACVGKVHHESSTGQELARAPGDCC
jgi:GTPase SAR1 family protein